MVGLRIAPVDDEGAVADNSPTIDRICNRLGYVPGNLIVVSHLANRVKNSASLDELRMVADYYCELMA